MAPVKFGLFKGRSRDQPEPPSTENLLQSSCTDLVVYPPSPIPSTSNGLYEDHNGLQELSLLHLDSDDEDESEKLPVRRHSIDCRVEEAQMNYKPLPSTTATSTTTLQESLQDEDLTDFQDQFDDIQKYEVLSADDATSIDANSLQFDQTSILSADVKYCGATRKQKRMMNRKTLPSTTTHTPITTLQKSLQLLREDILKYKLISPDDATSKDASSLQFDQSSIINQDVKYRGITHIQKRNRMNHKSRPSITTTTHTPTTTLQKSLQLLREDFLKYKRISPNDATSKDANSLQFDQSSFSNQDAKFRGVPRIQKRIRTKEEQKIQEHQNDYVMWQASNYEVLQHLLSGTCTLDEKIKWEAIATARGLCTLTATCNCRDCAVTKSPAAMTDGDGGMGAPIIGDFSMGCEIQ